MYKNNHRDIRKFNSFVIGQECAPQYVTLHVKTFTINLPTI